MCPKNHFRLDIIIVQGLDTCRHLLQCVCMCVVCFDLQFDIVTRAMVDGHVFLYSSSLGLVCYVSLSSRFADSQKKMYKTRVFQRVHVSPAEAGSSQKA